MRGTACSYPLTIRGRGKQSGAATTWDLWHVWTVRNGRFVTARHSPARPKPSKPPGCRSRRCRRRTSGCGRWLVIHARRCAAASALSVGRGRGARQAARARQLSVGHARVRSTGRERQRHGWSTATIPVSVRRVGRPVNGGGCGGQFVLIADERRDDPRTARRTDVRETDWSQIGANPEVRPAVPQARNPRVSRGFVRGGRWDSNPRPPGPQPGALPTELRPPREAQSSDRQRDFRAGHARRAPPARFERATCGLEVRRSIQLSYGGHGADYGLDLRLFLSELVPAPARIRPLKVRQCQPVPPSVDRRPRRGSRSVAARALVDARRLRIAARAMTAGSRHEGVDRVAAILG